MAFLAAVPGLVSSAGSFLMGNALSVAALAGTGLMAYGSYRQGQAEKVAADATALGMEQEAGQKRALAQHEAERQNRDNLRLLSRQRTLAAASGFDASDPTSMSLASDTVGAATLQELLTLAQGEDEARMTQYSADLTRRGGREAATAGRLAAGAQLLQGGMSWADRWGGGGGKSGGARKKPPGKPKTGGVKTGSPKVVSG